MPVTLHPVDRSVWEADAQVQVDLARIYADAPAERLPCAVDDFIRGHLSAGHTFLCARFNDRLLGAVAMEDDGESWWLAHCCVRKTTRRRGVGSQLLTLVAKSAHAEGRQLRASAAELPVADQMLLARLGYRMTQAGDYFVLDLSGQGGAS